MSNVVTKPGLEAPEKEAEESELLNYSHADNVWCFTDSEPIPSRPSNQVLLYCLTPARGSVGVISPVEV